MTVSEFLQFIMFVIANVSIISQIFHIGYCCVIFTELLALL